MTVSAWPGWRAFGSKFDFFGILCGATPSHFSRGRAGRMLLRTVLYRLRLVGILVTIVGTELDLHLGTRFGRALKYRRTPYLPDFSNQLQSG
jgi:hypothetical protein